MLDPLTKATCGPILGLTSISQTRGAEAGRAREATCKIAIIASISALPSRPGRHSGCTVIPGVSLAKRQVDGAEGGEENDPGSGVLVLRPLGICYKCTSSGASRYLGPASRGIPEGKDGSGGDGAVSLGIKV